LTRPVRQSEEAGEGVAASLNEDIIL
jgi:hypothetical protein